MRPITKRLARGFTLIELMIVVAIVGILAVLAIYGVRKYLSSAKTTEARSQVGLIAKDAIAAYERESSPGGVLTAGGQATISHQLCLTAAPNPTAIPRAQKVQPMAALWNTDVGWQCLKFTVDAPTYYQYAYTSDATATTSGQTFNATATGDLNGDNINSTFTMTGNTIAIPGQLTLAPNMTVVNEDE